VSKFVVTTTKGTDIVKADLAEVDEVKKVLVFYKTCEAPYDGLSYKAKLKKTVITYSMANIIKWRLM